MNYESGKEMSKTSGMTQSCTVLRMLFMKTVFIVFIQEVFYGNGKTLERFEAGIGTGGENRIAAL